MNTFLYYNIFSVLISSNMEILSVKKTKYFLELSPNFINIASPIFRVFLTKKYIIPPVVYKIYMK